MEPRDEHGLPLIRNIYLLQGMAEAHYLLKAEHPFTPQEVSTLLKYEDPLAAASACWEENTDRCAFDICGIMREHRLETVSLWQTPQRMRRGRPCGNSFAPRRRGYAASRDRNRLSAQNAAEDRSDRSRRRDGRMGV